MGGDWQGCPLGRIGISGAIRRSQEMVGRERLQPKREWTANKGKQMQINERKKAFICFYLLFRIGTFQWVTADSNKKIRPLSARVAGCAQMLLPALSRTLL
jgi:hypothetical protein